MQRMNINKPKETQPAIPISVVQNNNNFNYDNPLSFGTNSMNPLLPPQPVTRIDSNLSSSDKSLADELPAVIQKPLVSQVNTANSNAESERVPVVKKNNFPFVSPLSALAKTP